MLRGDNHATAEHKDRLPPDLPHGGAREVLPLAICPQCTHEPVAGVVIANGLMLWGVLSLLGIIAWRGLM